MVGLSEEDMEQIRDFAETPRYKREPEMLCADDEALETGIEGSS